MSARSPAAPEGTSWYVCVCVCVSKVAGPAALGTWGAGPRSALSAIVTEQVT